MNRTLLLESIRTTKKNQELTGFSASATPCILVICETQKVTIITYTDCCHQNTIQYHTNNLGVCAGVT
jgi:hypothetical protein